MPAKISKQSLFWTLSAILVLAASIGLTTSGVFASIPGEQSTAPSEVSAHQAERAGANTSSNSSVLMLPRKQAASKHNSADITVDAFAHWVPTTTGIITLTVGQTRTLDLYIWSGTDNDITAAQSYMTFTNSIIQVVDPTQPGCVLTSTIQPDLTTFDAVLQNETCNGPDPCDFRGQIIDPGSFAFASGALGTCPTGCQGDIRVAQMTICGSNGGRTIMHWQFSPPDPKTRTCEIVRFDGKTVQDRTRFIDLTIDVVGPTATPTSTRTASSTRTRTSTPTLTPTRTSTLTSTFTRTFTSTPSITPTPTFTLTPIRTNTPIITNTPIRTNTPVGTPTSTPCAGGGGWTAGTDYPSPMVRGVGVWFPSNGRFYVVGGRSADTAGTGIRNPHEFNPSTNTWTMMSAQLADDQTSNMAAAVLTGTSGPRIYTVGGSAGGGTVSSPRVQVYDPVGNTITELTSDPWPITPTGAVVPGGFAVFNNRMYIFGGFEINVGMRNQIWEFDPNRAAGSRWALKTATLPQPLGYVPATVIGNYIYTAGGSLWDGTTIADTQFTYRYDPVADAIDDASIPELPAPGTGETRALNWGGTMWVMGGGRTAPNPSNQVWTWTPGGTSWGTGPAFGTARRNFATDANPGVAVYIVGGYAINATMEIYRAGGPCVTPTPTGGATNTTTPTRTLTRTFTVSPTLPPTNTRTPSNTPGTGTPALTSTPTSTSGTPGMTNTPAGTATPCAMTFTDVLSTDYFYAAVRYLYCMGAISGYQDNTFRPYNDTTRGQLSKIVVLALGWPVIDPPTPTFIDVPRGSVFYGFVETAYAEGIISGYTCGTGCLEFRPNNNVTRGQLSKIIVLAMEWPIIDPPTPTFTDVARGSVFYVFVETAAFRQIIGGYNDRTFRPGNNATRGQICVIIYRAIVPAPLPTATPLR